ncbi:UvrABC system subunit C [Paenibacillus sp. FSL R7-0273]|uniref:GIY-YIG nuclease family protein n=1 Tax=Paenibacillus sp. FSL R7-0273 TaxID=1536772 RepID=UPI0004F5CA8B|nr:GIY-YIG nuclease family protein [Paenibacillus sp. FSL R7-0273]AIQ49945.1 UvrABC system subunit C [Paenibacillus sp. FSL R7-0273]OMF84522.1 DNA helicase UvrC [Paenibacillus sp. FSL R7-0273]
MNLTEKVHSLPLSPGVYLMKDSLGNIIYVGKAKRLRKRVQSYFYNNKGHSPKVVQLVRQIRDLEYRLTDTEFEAFMLECQLIKEMKPMYNRKMKNPLAYSYISVREDKGRRQFEVSYDPGPPGASLHFGPYTSRSTVERALQGIKESQRILCSSPNARGSLCLNHSLGLCLGMCGGGAALEAYDVIMDRIIALLDGRDTGILSDLEQRMAEAAERFDFEAAVKYRDYAGAVQALLQKEKVSRFTGENNSIAVLEPMAGDRIKLILIKGAQIIYRATLHSQQMDRAQLQAAVYAAILEQFAAAAAAGSAGDGAGTINRHTIDEAQIIYSYLKSSSGSYLIIPPEWLGSPPEPLLEGAVDKLVAGCLEQQEDAE